MTGYAEGHWTAAEPTERNLAQYVANNEAAYNRTKVAALERLLPADLRGRTVLDYGGGGGWMAVRCAARGADVVLVDAHPNALRLAGLLAERWGVAGRVETICSQVVPPVVKGRRFDIVLAKDVVEHIEDDAGFMADLAACQERGGLLLLSTQNRRSLNYLLEGSYRRWWCGEASWCGWDPTHVRFYTPASLRRLLAGAGYRPRRWWGVYVIPYNILSWLLLLRKPIELDGLHRFDLWFGGHAPFNRWGWNVLVAAERQEASNGGVEA